MERKALLVSIALLVFSCTKETTTTVPSLPEGTVFCALDGSSHTISSHTLTIDVKTQPSETDNTVVLTGEDGSIITMYFQGEEEIEYSFTRSGANRATYLDTLGHTYKSINGNITLTKYDNDSTITWVDGSFEFEGEWFSDKALAKITNGSLKDISKQ